MQPELNTQPTSFYFVAGEVSGDHHAAHLWVQIKKQLPTAVLHGVGGVHLKDAGQNQLFDLVEHAVVGLTDVLKNYFKFRDFFLKVIHDIVEKNLRCSCWWTTRASICDWQKKSAVFFPTLKSFTTSALKYGRGKSTAQR